ncbi:LPS glycosyltransferase [Trichostrongylus colubriformis]|uniref:LPS glycosyltransferase n=1 Tax=Trichostrongylus colubriformis TaxID=6319 RepID=A0AAN8GA94_TRICO
MWTYCIAVWQLALTRSATCLFPGAIPDEGDVRHLYPITHISIGLDNHAHMLPYLLGWLENIDYPKKRLRITFYQLNKDDSTENQLTWWKNSISSLFSSVTIVTNEANWLEAGLRGARLRKAGRVLLMSGDTLPRRGTLLQDLNSTEVVMSALFSPTLSSEMANCVTLSDDYRDREVMERRKISEAVLPMLINVVTIDSSYLTFDPDNLPNYSGGGDPFEVFVESAERMQIGLWIDNLKLHGFYIDETLEVYDRRRKQHLYRYTTMPMDYLQLRYLLADIVADGAPLPLASHSVRPWIPEPQLWEVEKIYMINLKRRPERRARMEKIFEILGVDATYWEATDGQNLPKEYKYEILPGYMDPIWQDVLKLGLSRVAVFEDDLRFTDGGLERIKEVLEDLDLSKMEWDLIYLGRKKQADQEELWVRNHRHLSTVGYSYWTLGYLLSAEGARRLIDAKPLEKLLPVDEYFPIMFNKHPNKEWASHFPVRNLRAFTLYPLSVFPQRYTYEEGYVSDTEDSVVVVDENAPMRSRRRMSYNGSWLALICR